MNPAILVPVLLVFFAGGMIAIQAPTNAMLARAGGSPVLAALISFAVGTAALLAAWIVSGNRPGTAPFAGLPWYAWIGGLYGATFVAVAAYAAPKIGLASLIPSASLARSRLRCGSTTPVRSVSRASRSTWAASLAPHWSSLGSCWFGAASERAIRAVSCRG